MSKRAHIITGVIVGVVFLGCLGAIQGWWWDESEPETSTIDQAQGACYDAVLAELKAPSTADLVDISAYPEDDHWVVTGSVDAENSFGATIRSTFECAVQQSGRQWQVDSVDIS